MTLIQHNIAKLNEIQGLLNQLSTAIYTKPREILNEATIGQHFRHILEFYICLEKGGTDGEVCYDDRKRDVLLETDLSYVQPCIRRLTDFIVKIESDKPLVLKASYSVSSGNHTIINTTLFRELAYALDHTVHHLAIVRIALMEEKDEVTIASGFGVAPSTVRFREQNS